MSSVLLTPEKRKPQGFPRGSLLLSDVQLPIKLLSPQLNDPFNRLFWRHLNEIAERRFSLSR
jgi:hypothetical protein